MLALMVSVIRPQLKLYVFYPWVMLFLTVRITEAFGLPKPSLFCNVQRDVDS